MVEFCLLTFSRFPLLLRKKKEHKSCFDKNRTHDFRTSRCAGYLLDHSGDTTKTNKQLAVIRYNVNCTYLNLPNNAGKALASV